jgi:hypothetical protein
MTLGLMGAAMLGMVIPAPGAYEDEDDVWMILQSVGSRVAEELGDAILDEGDED